MVSTDYKLVVLDVKLVRQWKLRLLISKTGGISYLKKLHEFGEKDDQQLFYILHLNATGTRDVFFFGRFLQIASTNCEFLKTTV
jgi:hypothetical protein